MVSSSSLRPRLVNIMMIDTNASQRTLTVKSTSELVKTFPESTVLVRSLSAATLYSTQIGDFEICTYFSLS